VPVPNVVVPSRNVTVPVAVLGDTVAVKVTDCPNTDGFADDATAVVVLVFPTFWVTAVLVLPLKLASPPYWAVIEKLPEWVNVTVSVAVPVPDNALDPIVAVPLRNVTVPVGVPAPGEVTLTVAVKVTACATADGLGDEASAVVVLALVTV
jgi:hypothetical protein